MALMLISTACAPLRRRAASVSERSLTRLCNHFQGCARSGLLLIERDDFVGKTHAPDCPDDRRLRLPRRNEDRRVIRLQMYLARGNDLTTPQFPALIGWIAVDKCG